MYLNTEIILKLIITALLLIICYLYIRISKLAQKVDLLATIIFKQMGAIGYMSDSQKKIAKIVEDILNELQMEPSDPEDLKFEDPLQEFKKRTQE